VANGHKLLSSALCKNFTWTINEEESQTDVVIVPLGSSEMRLSTLGPILWDLAKLKMEFSHQEKQVVIEGTQQAAIQWVEGKAMQHVLSTSTAPQLFAIQAHSVADEPIFAPTQITNSSLAQLLSEFEDIFAEPKGLPPNRSHDYHIILSEGAPPINVKPYKYPVKPYKYPALQNDVFEKNSTGNVQRLGCEA